MEEPFESKKILKQSESSSPNTLSKVVEQAVIEKDEDEPMCRYCFCGPEEGPLISPCQCKGGQKYVHLSCLRRWQRMVLVSQPTHPLYYEDDVRHHKCNVCTTNFTCPPPKRVELMESFTGAEIAALVREGCIIASSPAFSADIESKLHSMHLIERHLSGLDHWCHGVFLITSVEPESSDVKLRISSQEKLEAICSEFDEDNVIRLQGKPLVLLSEGSLSGCSSPEELREAFQRLRAPTTITLRSLTPPNYGDDHIEAVNLVRREERLSKRSARHVQKAIMHAKQKIKVEQLPEIQITHYIGGPCHTDQITACLVFTGSGRGWRIVDNLESAIQIACKQYEEPIGTTDRLRRGQSVKIVGLKANAELNGQLGLTLRFEKESSRWCIRTFDGSGKKIRPVNLEAVENENGHIMCFWGNAIWTRTQLLGEIARGSWGLCCASIVDLIKPIEGKWSGLQGRLAFSPITEMSEDYIRRATEEMNSVQMVAPAIEQGNSHPNE